jgi:L,D-peptidoglycan transpeptidase YkuD (ErfK/YbiS/YcfS/YnhG family)
VPLPPPLPFVVKNNTLSHNDKTYRCAVGKNGLTANKKEGDGCTPTGIFTLRECWYRMDRMEAPKTRLPLSIIRPEDGWCDDPANPFYNKHIKLPFDASHEILFREDESYDLIIPISYNDMPVVPGAGSAIFIHVAHEDYAPTQGCIALNRADLLQILCHCDTDQIIDIQPA